MDARPVACAALAREVRDPATGSCFTVSGCINTPASDYPDCTSSCDSLVSTTCAATASCIAASFTDGRFFGCWATSETVHTGSCAGLDAVDCLHHDNCTVSYTHSGAFGQFAHCDDKPVNQPLVLSGR